MFTTLTTTSAIVLQSAVPIPDAGIVIAFSIGVLVGLAIPTGYGLERLAGLGRALLSRLPYTPPPGMDEETALRRTSGAAGDVPDGADDDAE